MIIEKLEVTDFRVFQGHHEFSLSPRQRWNALRPIVLFGGLNGAGKTSILTAVRLALYGKQSLGVAIAQKQYETFLKDSIHKSKSSVLQSTYACISLTFQYAHMGMNNHYTVKRSWSIKRTKVLETIDIECDGKSLDKLSYEQKQGFLNELIPIGVSDLFFFDGEKIAELASDQNGSALSDAIKKLLGLDLVERLSADINVLTREYDKRVADDTTKERIREFEKEFNRVNALAEKTESEFEDLLPQLREAKTLYEFEEREFLAKGGAWANSRAQEIERQKQLEAQRSLLQEELRHLLAGPYPLSLARDFVEETIQQVVNEESGQRDRNTEGLKQEILEKLATRLESVLTDAQFEKAKKVIQEEIIESGLAASSSDIIHSVGGRILGRIEAAAEEAQTAEIRVKELATRLSGVSDELEQVSIRIARAPDEITLEASVKKLNEMRSKVERYTIERETLREEAKRYIREALEIARRLDELHDKVESSGKFNKNMELAKKTQSVLGEFSHRASAAKTKVLETEFSRCFQRLARKEDMLISACIDPKTYQVTLQDESHQEIDKNQLSAGERQIYAISMLEALARTSGRKLPIIIDTPLGRLDSKHRDKLVNHYFPTASHQVVILSTDTEVDEGFYADMYKNMSHAYKLEYDSDSGSTSAEEGYFWKTAVKTEAA